jgi:hypothetical protein
MSYIIPVGYIIVVGDYIFGWILLFICSLVLHLLIRKPILDWVGKKDKGQRREGKP